MAIEHNLPDNVSLRLDKYAAAARGDVRRLQDAHWHLQSAFDRLMIDGPQDVPINTRAVRPDPLTVQNIALALRLVAADLVSATQRSDSADAMADAADDERRARQQNNKTDIRRVTFAPEN